jgi:small GTP-binding protein
MLLSRDIGMIKLVVIGDPNVGKTSILNEFVNREFSTDYQPTIGLATMTRQLEVDGAFITLNLWDTAGQERFRALGVSFYRGTQICVIVYDITSASSFVAVREWHSTFTAACGHGAAEISMLLLGNKLDVREQREVEADLGREFAAQNGMIFFEVSAQTAEGIVTAFEAAVRHFLARNRIRTPSPMQAVEEASGIDCEC